MTFITSTPRTVTFIDQASNADQFLTGGVYSAAEGPVGLVLSAFESRRSSSNTMWQAAASASYESFGSSSSFSADIAELQSQIGQITKNINLATTITPVDYNEYVNAIFTDESGEVTDVAPAHSLQLNLRPEQKGSSSTQTIYATFGKSVAQSLAAVEDPEGAAVYTVVHNTGDNYKLNLWVNEARTYLFSN